MHRVDDAARKGLAALRWAVLEAAGLRPTPALVPALAGQSRPAPLGSPGPPPAARLAGQLMA
ncbi:MAG: hypothetical protein M3211_10970, partial [Actinomycetota bacterium]|nr:hypothetical protein [Actinomycetota bacterium]